ncbi:MAG: pyridoxal phosphate-dependent aminotransferase [Spirochaetaceae bacterium]
MALNHLETARRGAGATGRLIDLIDTNFHSQGILPPPEPFRRGFEEYLSRRRYRPDPQGSLPARESIAAFYASRGLPVSPEDIVLCASTSEAYSLIFSTFGRAGDSVALPLPGYPLAEYLARQNRLVPGPILRDFRRGFHLDLDTAFLVAVSPDNPTGRIVSSEELELLQRAAQATSAFLIWDEVFCDLVFAEGEPGASRDTAHPLATGDGPPTFVLNGASKLFAAPDIKVGWIVITGSPRRRAALRERLAVANDHYLSSSSFSQEMLPHLFRDLGAFRRQMRETVRRRRDCFLRWCRREARVEVVPPQGGIHALCFVPGLESVDDETFALALLAGDPPVYVHPGSLYGTGSTPVSFVVSLLTVEAELERGLEAVSAAITDARRRIGS